MKPHYPKTDNHTNRSSGFALIASITIMGILVLIGVALFSLSSVATKSAHISAARTEAQANAKMALNIAIGNLQAELGPDQRISANAAIRDNNIETDDIEGVRNPHWIGVWDSWVAGDLASASVNPDYPSSPSLHQTIGDPTDTNLRAGMHPAYTQKDDHFRRWLVSLNPSDTDASNPVTAETSNLNGEPLPQKGSSAVRLVGSGSLGPSAKASDFVNAQLLDVEGDGKSPQSGRYAWWVGDQSQKATILADSYAIENNLSDADRIYRAQAPANMGNSMLPGLETITDESQFSKLATFKTLDLISSGSPASPNQPKLSQQSFHHASTSNFSVLADVREGGLKRDLSLLLERSITRSENADQFMLYAFDDPRFEDRSNSRVPIQDLAAYYQLYDHEPALDNQRREGVHFNSSKLSNSIQLNVPNFDGDSKDRQRILREYTTLYRQPVITKVQFLVAITAEEVTPEERQWVQDRYDQAEIDRAMDPRGPLARSKILPMRDTDTHKLRLGLMPMITLWNPNNIPLVMDDAQILRFATPPFGFRFRKYRDTSSGGPEIYDLNWSNLSYAAGFNFGGVTTGQASGYPILRLRFARNADPIVFEPGEVKVFSLPASTGAKLNEDGDNVVLVDKDRNLDTENSWDPYGFYIMTNSSPRGAYENEAPEAYGYTNSSNRGEWNQSLVFNPNDRITFRIEPDSDDVTASGSFRDGRYVSAASEIKGAGFSLYYMDEDYQIRWQDNLDHIRHYTLVSRHGGNNSDGSNNKTIAAEVAAFNQALITPGFPGGVALIDFDDKSNAIPGDQIISSGEANEVISLFDFSFSLGCEIGTLSSGGFGGGRRIASRPFLHSPLSAAPFIDQSDKNWLYNYGWDWQLAQVNAVEDSIVRAEPGTGNGYYGGGYTLEAGTTHVVQREIPVVPPISIASLSHAQLGGFSLGYAMPIGENPENDTFFKRDPRLKKPEGLDYQRTTASGGAGLGPHVVQAIGNSYAHPNIPAEEAFTTKIRLFDADDGEIDDVPFVDHSYLANKSLWDEFFFSSITPQPSKVPLFGSAGRTAKQVADDFFFNDEPLVNRRIVPHKENLDQTELDTLFTKANTFSDGLADKIAAHLMVAGAFNINSTSVKAWRVLLSSLKDQPVAYFDGGTSPQEVELEGIPLGSGILPNEPPIETSDITSSNAPPEQWKTGRVLTEIEINELAEAIVKQVKLRGPFLSLSEFINRRLEGDANADERERSVKGALQAAIDDEDVSINASFRQPNRMLDSETSNIDGFDFPAAATGPIAYGSMPYIDQADVLQHLSEQITPRGDTFIVRTYGDSLDASGEVIARVWCEATVQRVPEYCDPTNLAHKKQSDLTETNQNFGRKLKIIDFRWLDADEV